VCVPFLKSRGFSNFHYCYDLPMTVFDLHHHFQSLKNLLPYHCLICQKACPYRSLCLDCQTDLPWLTPHHCIQCATPLTLDHPTGNLCGKCLTKPPPFNHTFALFHYTNPIKQWVHRIKSNAYQPLLTIFDTFLQHRILQQYKLHSLMPKALIAMPQHPKRTKQRGFNPSHILCQKLSKKLGIKNESHIITRLVNHPKQSLLTKKQRTKNLKVNDFIMTDAPSKHVALIDDVVTTGTSTRVISNLLKKAGCIKIDVWCLARA
jgi:ComF family protein